MKEQRIKQLEKYLENDPQDTFSKYALAMELREDNPERAGQLYDDLLLNHPEYTGTYYHAASFFSELGEREKAESIYLKGIEIISHTNEANALRELKNAYQNFQFED